MTDMVQSAHARPKKPTQRSAFSKFVQNLTLRRGITAIIVFAILWEFGSRFDEWFGDAWRLPMIGLIPALLHAL